MNEVNKLSADLSAGREDVMDTAGEVDRLRRENELLKKTEQNYRRVFEDIEDVYYRADIHGSLEEISPSGLKLLNYEKYEDMIGINIADEAYKNPQERDTLKALIFENGRVTNYPVTLKTKDGEAVFVETSSHIYFDDEGKPAGIEGVIRNITGRKKMEDELLQYQVDLESLVHRRTAELKEINALLEKDIKEKEKIEIALKESEEKYRSLVENINEVIFKLDTDSVFTYISPAIFKLSGYHQNEITGRKLFKYIHSDDLPKLFSQYQDILDGSRVNLEYRILCRDGSERYVSSSCIMVRNGDGSAGILGVTNDVHERVMAEESLRESENKFRTFAEHIPSAVFILQDNKLCYANQAFSKISGYAPEEVEGLNFLDLIHPDYRDISEERQSSRLNGAAMGTTYEIKAIVRGNKCIWIEYVGAIIEYNRKPAILISAVDITERKRLEEEVVKNSKIESLGVFAGGIAHDFNNLLTAILGNISLAQMDVPDNTIVHTTLREAEKATLRARDLTQQLLTFSKGGAPIKKISDITSLVKETIAFILSGSRVKCRYNVDEMLWHADVDRGQFSQVVQNCVINALQAMPEGGEIIVAMENVAISRKDNFPVENGDYVKISIVDNGEGISEEALGRIFDPYFTTKSSGSGLGLAIVYSIIRKHNGHIAITSRQGSGTTVTMYLPASGEKIRGDNDQGKMEIFAGGKILLMDDDPMILDTGTRMLNRLGFHVQTAVNGEQALECYAKAVEKGPAFDLVIMDLTIPGGMGGVETLKHLKSIDSNVRTIVSSGYSNDPVMSHYTEYGFMGVMAKPYQLEELQQVIENIFNTFKKCVDAD